MKSKLEGTKEQVKMMESVLREVEGKRRKLFKKLKIWGKKPKKIQEKTTVVQDGNQLSAFE